MTLRLDQIAFEDQALEGIADQETLKIKVDLSSSRNATQRIALELNSFSSDTSQQSATGTTVSHPVFHDRT